MALAKLEAASAVGRVLIQRGAHMQKALALCVVASIAAHALLLTMRMKPEPLLPASGFRGTTATVAMQVRTVSGQEVPGPPPIASDSERNTGQSRLSSSSAQPPPPTPRRIPADALPRKEVAAPARAEAKSAAPAQAAGQPGATAHVSEAHDQFIPRPLLSIPPVAQAPVILVAPPDETQVARYVGVLSLFIDEEGQVRRISASEPLLPPAFEQAAREAFMAARFAPGQLDGIAVKSRVRVEVVFDNTLPRP